MSPEDSTKTQVSAEHENSLEDAWDAGMAAAFGPVETGSYQLETEPEAGTILAGKYRLSERIGQGGMGSVWLANQSEPVKRKVAVKLIKPGMDSKQVLARFEAERQALAVMDHPNIAKVLDGGLHDGRPFFVMELVKGVPITKYCDDRTLTPKQRLELFVPICQAIQHAHQKGIIHRDIKPSNVLIALYDDKPVPKVIDFGVAKATGAALTDKTFETAFGGVVGTPAYMSPEQASLNNLDIDTRSDVYSLGVLLYELLTGSPPFARKELEKRGLLEMLRIVREEEPPRPSTKLSSSQLLPSLSANRGTEPKKLTGLLRNELDWIVMKALEKDRARRYETANGFAADVNRYLSGEAVLAHPPSRAYRLKKFVRRNRPQVVAAGLVLFTLLAGIAGTTAGLIEARRQERAAVAAQQAESERAEGERLAKLDAEAKKAEAQREQARAEANEKLASERLVQVEAEKKRADEEKQIAHAVQNFLQNKLLAQAETAEQANQLLLAGESAGDANPNLTIRELLDRAASELTPDKIETNFPNQPRVQAEILHTVGKAYLGVGEAATAVQYLTRCLDLFRRHLGSDHPTTLISMGSLGLSYKAAGKLDLALPLLEETLKLRKAKLGLNHPNTLRSMNNLALGYIAIGKLDLALPLLEETYRLKKAKLGSDHPVTLTSMGNLAEAYREVGQLDLALPLLVETVRLKKAQLGPDHPNTLRSMNNLALGYRAIGKLDLGFTLLEETLQITKAQLGPDHPDTLNSMNNLATSYRSAGQLDQALPLLEETLRLTINKLGPNHPDTLNSMANLAVGYREADQLDLAMPLLEETLRLTKAKLGPDHQRTLISMGNLAMGYRATGRLDLAIPLFEKTLKLMKAKLGPDHPNTLISMGNLAEAYRDVGQIDKALPLFEETLKLEKAKFGLDHPSTLISMDNLATCYRNAGKFDLALPLFEETLRLRKAKLGPDHPDTLTSMSHLAVGYQDVRRPENALPLFEEALKLRKDKLGTDHPDALSSMNNLAMNYWDLGKINLALPLLEETLKLRKAKLGLDHPDTLTSMSNLATYYRSQKRLDEAVVLFEEVLALRKKRLGSSHPETQKTVADLGVSYKFIGRWDEALPLLEKANSSSKKLPILRWVGPHLLEVYSKAGMLAEAAILINDQLEEARKTLPKNSPNLSGFLAHFSKLLLEMKGFTQAEPMLRECLTIREKTQPDVWTTFNTQSLLGWALLGQKKYAEAEPLLLNGYEGMKAREKTIPPAASTRLPEALDRLIELYTAIGKTEAVKKYQELRSKYPPELAPMPREKK